MLFFFFFQAEDGIRDDLVTGVQTCALPISGEKGPILTSFCFGTTQFRDVSDNNDAPGGWVLRLILAVGNYPDQQRPLRFVLRCKFYFDLGAVCYSTVNHAPRFFQSPKHIAAKASCQKRARCEFQTFTGAINFL